MKKFAYILVIALLGVSCDPTEGPVYDVENGQALAAFNRTVQTYPVDDSGESFTEILVGVSTVSAQDRAVSISIDPASTADPSEYTIDPASLVIPAGEFVAKVRLFGNFNNIPETGQTNVILNLDSVEGSILDNEATGRLSHRVNLFRFCPFSDGATFLGDYELTVLTTGIFGVETFIPGTVTLTEGATVADRRFTASLYAAFGGFGPYTWEFSLICGEVVVPSSVNTGVGCGGSIVVGPPDVNATYNSADDSEITINFTDDVGGQGQCGAAGGPVQISIKLTKI
jgi:hypothetical protein